MRKVAIFCSLVLIVSLQAVAEEYRHGEIRSGEPILAWDKTQNAWVTPEVFWINFADSRGGLTWSNGEEYPPYREVKEHDTFMVVLDSGPCLMEFFHSRWRRANDVRRWDPMFNEYGGCPNVFD